MALLNYQDKLFIEMMEEFKEKYIHFVERCEKLLFDLQNPERYNIAVNELFRAFHTLKSNAALFEIKPLVKTASAVEDVLGVLRHKKPPISRDLLDWLLLVSDFMKIWAEHIEADRYDLEPIDSYTLHMIKVTASATEKRTEFLSDTIALVYEPDITERQRISNALQLKVKQLIEAKTREEAVSFIKQYRPNFILLAGFITNFNTVEFVRAIKKSFDIPIVILTPSDKIKELENFGNMIDGYLSYPISLNLLENRMNQLCDLYYSNKEIKIVDKSLIDYVKNLQALPQTVFEVQNKIADPEFALRDLATIVSKDPIVASKILSLVNSPIYGFREPIASVNQAVTLLGKEQTLAIVIQTAGVETLGTMDLSPYKIGADIFYEVSKMRMDLMVNWYSKVSFAHLPVLATTALLGNLGQLIIARTIKDRKKEAHFENIFKSTAVSVAEIETVGATAEDISADILAFWGLDTLVVDAIRYSRDLARAGNEIKEYAVANYIVYNTIQPTSIAIDPKDVNDMVDFVKEMNMKPDAYLRAVEKIALI